MVLVVDDDVRPRRGVERVLARRFGGDYRVLGAESGFAALVLLNELIQTGQQLALVLADQWMPGLTGIELLALTRDLHPHARRILLTDYGDDRFTQGRPHPMIDWTLRLAELRRVAAEPETAVILLDVVLGHGSHQDPARLLAPALAEIGKPAVAYVCGTDADPQDRRRQSAELAAAGALLADSNLAAAHLAGLLLKEAMA